jgi:hypothetical protein
VSSYPSAFMVGHSGIYGYVGKIFKIDLADSNLPNK